MQNLSGLKAWVRVFLSHCAESCRVNSQGQLKDTHKALKFPMAGPNCSQATLLTGLWNHLLSHSIYIGKLFCELFSSATLKFKFLKNHILEPRYDFL